MCSCRHSKLLARVRGTNLLGAVLLAMQNACTKEEQQSVIHFLVKEGVKSIATWSSSTVTRAYRYSRCKNGVGSLGMACLVWQMLLDWARPTSCNTAGSFIGRSCHHRKPLNYGGRSGAMLDIIHGSGCHIIRDMLQFRKVDAWTEGEMCGCLPRTFAIIRNRRWWLPAVHSDWWWKLGPPLQPETISPHQNPKNSAHTHLQ